MSSVPYENLEEQQVAPLQRKENVFMGRQDYLSVLLRLVGAELYKLRRRAMSKVLSIIALSIILFGLLLTGLPALSASGTPSSDYLPPQCSTSTDSTQTCLNHTPTQADLSQATSAKQDSLQTASTPLRLPGSFITTSQIIQGIGLVLIIILAGTIVGGEYAAGTIRVLYTRGPTRTQFLLAKALCLLVCIFLGVVVLLIAGVLLGILLNLITGAAMDFRFFTPVWFLHAATYIGIVILGLLIYALLALCLATLGKATAAGLTGALIWWGLESILGGIFLLASSITKGISSTILKALPDYFIGNNINALLANQNVSLTGGDAGTLSDIHALLVLLAYGIIFLGCAWLVNWRRDVVN